MGTAVVQGELWGRAPRVWAGTMEPQMRPLYEATFARLAGSDSPVEPLLGLRLLDAGCGAGLALQMAADRGASVAGVDASAPLLAVAAGRVPGADLRAGDIDALPFPGGTFDRATAFNAIQYAADPAQAVAELARVTCQGGLVAVGIWGEATRCETEGLFARLRSLAPPPPGTPAPLACSDPGVVEELMDKAGLRVVDGGEVPISLRFDDLAEAVAAHTSAGPLQKVIDAAGTEPVQRVIEDVLEADRKPDGTLRQDNVMRFVVAAKP